MISQLSAPAAAIGAFQALDALSRLEPVAGRGASFQAVLGAGGRITVIDESYNANPASMAAALTSLKARAPQRGGSQGEGSVLGGLGNLLNGDNNRF